MKILKITLLLIGLLLTGTLTPLTVALGNDSGGSMFFPYPARLIGLQGAIAGLLFGILVYFLILQFEQIKTAWIKLGNWFLLSAYFLLFAVLAFYRIAIKELSLFEPDMLMQWGGPDKWDEARMHITYAMTLILPLFSLNLSSFISNLTNPNKEKRNNSLSLISVITGFSLTLFLIWHCGLF